jgi:L-gulonate 3-dehydrogenase
MTIKEVSCVGVGTIGRAWAAAFASAGLQVTLFDHRRSACDDALRWIADALGTLESAGFLDSADKACSRLVIAPDLGTALARAEYVQESVPENLEIKQAVFGDFDQWSRPEAILASSTSALPGRLFMGGLRERSRSLVAHPVNPPHLIPVVEICPTPWTSELTLSRCIAFLRTVGQEPVQVRKEINGFILNRLQMALIGEALHLVGEGYCSPEDLDKTVRFGLGLRWAFMGPFETGHLNAPRGYGNYMTKFRSGMEKLLADLKVNQPFDEALIRRIDAACQKVTPAAEVPERQRWRDAQLLALRKHFARVRTEPRP